MSSDDDPLPDLVVVVVVLIGTGDGRLVLGSTQVVVLAWWLMKNIRPFSAA